jgi:hypothetical protein
MVECGATEGHCDDFVTHDSRGLEPRRDLAYTRLVAAKPFRRHPRGRSAVGFEIEPPGELQLQDGPVVVCREQRADGRVLGEIELAVFEAPLIIDRDGVLAERAETAADREAGRPGAVAVAVQLPGASGFRADAVVRGPLPYVHAFALAPSDLGLRGGVLITVRAASPDWASAEQLLRSLRMVSVHGVVPGDADAGAGPLLPILEPK